MQWPCCCMSLGNWLEGQKLSCVCHVDIEATTHALCTRIIK
jgi:hypothetical protein